MNTKITFLDKEFANPIVTASGVLGVTGATMVNNVKEKGVGGVTMKSVSVEPREGHPNPTITTGEHFMINAVGLSNAGAENSVKEIKYYKENCQAPLIASVFAGDVEEFGEVTKKISEASPDFIEVNISCPNVEDEFGKPFAADPELAAEVTKIVKENTDIKVIVKLSPNVSSIGMIAQAVEAAGADAICAVNTFNGTLIDVRTREFVLHNKFGGVSGPAIKPMAVKAVYDISQAVKIPIIGTGGVTTGQDVLEMMLAGATLVGVGSAVYFGGGKDVFANMMGEIEQIMKEEGVEDLTEMIGGVKSGDEPAKACVVKK
ncbi:dihydroorotate dehydrogenase [Patescibacteria group bacterium]|nr:dihydroorotate dehydrogenase [Patescibacteria group bacterium]